MSFTNAVDKGVTFVVSSVKFSVFTLCEQTVSLPSSAASSRPSSFASRASMAATNDKLAESIRRLSRNDSFLTTLELRDDPLKTNSTLTSLGLEGNRVGEIGRA